MGLGDVFVLWLWALPMLELYVDVAVEKQGRAAALTLACAYLWQFHRPWLWSSAPLKSTFYILYGTARLHASALRPQLFCRIYFLLDTRPLPSMLTWRFKLKFTGIEAYIEAMFPALAHHGLADLAHLEPSPASK
jgi:hypothetical protein